MIGLLQRVDTAQVAVEGAVIAAIQRGLLVLVGVEAQDGRAEADRLLERLLGYRVFPDGDGKMNLSLRDVGGGRVGAWSRGPGFRGCDGGGAC
jgi:D-tyrosyl-tRNA(Tyr) deacylase